MTRLRERTCTSQCTATSVSPFPSLSFFRRSGDSKGSHPQPLAVEIVIPSFSVLKTQHTLKCTVHGGQLRDTEAGSETGRPALRQGGQL